MDSSGLARYDSVLKRWFKDFLREGHKWKDYTNKGYPPHERWVRNRNWSLWLYTYIIENQVKFMAHNFRHNFTVILYFNPYTKILVNHEVSLGKKPSLEAIRLVNRILEIFDAPFYIVFNTIANKLEYIPRKTKQNRIYQFIRLARLVTSVSPKIEEAREEYMRICRELGLTEGDSNRRRKPPSQHNIFSEESDVG